MLTYSLYDIIFYFLLYGFLGWVVEVSYYSVRDRRFVNRGFLSLPLQEPCGFSYALLILIMPSLGKRFVIQFIAAATVFAACAATRSISAFTVSGASVFELCPAPGIHSSGRPVFLCHARAYRMHDPA